MWRSRFFVWVDLNVFYASSNIQIASEQFVSCIHICFVNFAVHPTPQTKIWQIPVRRFKQLCFSDHSDLDKCPYEFYYSQWLILSPPKTWTFLLNHPVYRKAIFCSVCRNGAGLLPNRISTNTTGKGSCSVSLGSFMLPPIRLLIW